MKLDHPGVPSTRILLCLFSQYAPHPMFPWNNFPSTEPTLLLGSKSPFLSAAFGIAPNSPLRCLLPYYNSSWRKYIWPFSSQALDFFFFFEQQWFYLLSLSLSIHSSHLASFTTPKLAQYTATIALAVCSVKDNYNEPLCSPKLV